MEGKEEPRVFNVFYHHKDIPQTLNLLAFLDSKVLELKNYGYIIVPKPITDAQRQNHKTVGLLKTNGISALPALREFTSKHSPVAMDGDAEIINMLSRIMEMQVKRRMRSADSYEQMAVGVIMGSGRDHPMTMAESEKTDALPKDFSGPQQYSSPALSKIQAAVAVEKNRRMGGRRVTQHHQPHQAYQSQSGFLRKHGVTREDERDIQIAGSRPAMETSASPMLRPDQPASKSPSPYRTAESAMSEPMKRERRPPTTADMKAARIADKIRTQPRSSSSNIDAKQAQMMQQMEKNLLTDDETPLAGGGSDD